MPKAVAKQGKVVQGASVASVSAIPPARALLLSPAALEAALAALPRTAINSGRKFIALIQEKGLADDWNKAAQECAKVGLSGLDDKEATKLLADLLPYPRQSNARSPKSPANANWHAHALYFSGELCKRHGFVEFAGATISSGTPYPVMFTAARIKALADLGADPVASKALLRAAFRKSLEEIQAVWAMPGCPSPGTCPPGAASPLHKACYDGPNDQFAFFASRSSAQDWLSLNPSGQLPLDKAYQSDSVGRAAVAMKMTSLEGAGADANGDTPLHRLADHLGAKGPSFDPARSGWLQALADLAAMVGSDAFAAKDAQGMTPMQRAKFGPSQQALLARHAMQSKSEIDGVASEQSCEAPKPRQRL